MIQTFWHWLSWGAPNSRPGWSLVLNRWLVLHVGVAVALSLAVKVDPFTFAAKALFPAASILVGMAVAWTSRATAVLQDKSFRSIVITDDRPLEDYLYGYQLSLLIIISMVVYVAIMASGGFRFIVVSREISQYISGFFLYLFLSIAIRECWTVINFSNLLSLLHDKLPNPPYSRRCG